MALRLCGGKSVILHPSMLFISFFAVIMRYNFVVSLLTYFLCKLYVGRGSRVPTLAVLPHDRTVPGIQWLLDKYY